MSTQKKLMTDWRWWICSLLFVATTVNYLDLVDHRGRIEIALGPLIIPDGKIDRIRFRAADLIRGDNHLFPCYHAVSFPRRGVLPGNCGLSAVLRGIPRRMMLRRGCP